jgi:hypothetical protein
MYSPCRPIPGHHLNCGNRPATRGALAVGGLLNPDLPTPAEASDDQVTKPEVSGKSKSVAPECPEVDRAAAEEPNRFEPLNVRSSPRAALRSNRLIGRLCSEDVRLRGTRAGQHNRAADFRSNLSSTPPFWPRTEDSSSGSGAAKSHQRGHALDRWWITSNHRGAGGTNTPPSRYAGPRISSPQRRDAKTFAASVIRATSDVVASHRPRSKWQSAPQGVPSAASMATPQ